MRSAATLRLEIAITGDHSRRYVVVDVDDRLHDAATAWLGFLEDIGRSPKTVEHYGRRLAYYLSWTARTAEWRSVGLAHLAMWRRVLATTPITKANGQEALRSDRTVGLWMTPVRSFYEWADAQGMLVSDVATRMTQLKWFAPGTPGGGEHGVTRRVFVPELASNNRSQVQSDPKWIDDAGARERLELLDLNARDRFFVDLLYFTGIRVGEALSLFTKDMHLGGGSPALGCRLADAHFHVTLDNPVENGARAKGCARILPVNSHLVERYIDYVLERQEVLGADDRSPHALVNLYTHPAYLGRAMTYSGAKALMDRVGARIGFDISGPHMLRHTLATRLIRGIDCEQQREDVVGAILGHRSAASIRVYTHDVERAKRAALDAIAPRSIVLAGD